MDFNRFRVFAWFIPAVFAVFWPVRSGFALNPADYDEIPPVIAILDIRLDGVELSETVQTRLNEHLSSQIAGKKAYLVVPRDQVSRALVQQKVKSQDPCYGSCQVTLGGAVGATKILQSKVMGVGSVCWFVADVYDLQSETLELSETVKDLECTELGLMEGIETVAERLVRSSGDAEPDARLGGGTVTHGVPIDRGETIVNESTDKTGFLFVNSTPSNASLFINGRAVGTAPYQDSLMVGRYVVVADFGSYYHAARQEIDLTTQGATVSLNLPPAFGSLTVTSIPSGADVLIDDKPVGKTPYTDSRLLSGQHIVEVRRNLFTPERRTVTVTDGQALNEAFVLVEDSGKITVRSDPPGAVVSLDGRDLGKLSPLSISPVKSGTHVISIEKTGYGRRVETVVVERGVAAEVNVKLDPKYGNLTVMSQGVQDGKPCRGPVSVDGVDVGQTPWKGQVLAEVSHQVQVDCGGQAKKVDVKVAHNESRKLKFEVDNPAAAVVAVTRESAPSADAGRASKNDKYAAFDARRTRASFQGRLSGGLDLNLASAGVGGLVQIGVGTGRWFDIHTGVGFPGYVWVTDFEVNLWPYGRFIPTLAARVSLGFHPDNNVYAFDFTAGVEMWATTWLAFYIKLGVGYSWNLTHDVSGVYVPGWLGVEFRY